MVEALGINLMEILFAIANFLILTGVLTKFLYKPFLNMLDNRKQSIKDAFDNAEAVNRRADEKLENYNKRIANVEQEAREIIKDAKVRADKQAAEIVDNANKEAERVLAQAQAEIARERQVAMEEAKGEIANIALLVAEKVLQREITVTGQTEIMDDILKEAGGSGWQN